MAIQYSIDKLNNNILLKEKVKRREYKKELFCY